MTRWMWLAMALVLVGWGCSTTAEGTQDEDRQIMGSPPTEGDPNYEFARPDGERADPVAEEEASLDEVGETLSEGHLGALLRRGPSVLMRHVEVEPVHDEDDFVGYEVVELSEASARHLGDRVRIGDVVTHLNGVRIEKPDDYLNAWTALNEVDTVRVDLIREDESMEVSWPITE